MGTLSSAEPLKERLSLALPPPPPSEKFQRTSAEERDMGIYNIPFHGFRRQRLKLQQMYGKLINFQTL